MAKTKQSGSAAQRRAQERQQRQRRDEVRVSTLNRGKSSGTGPRVRKKDRSGLYMVIGVLALITVIIIAFYLISRQPAPLSANLKPSPANKGIVQQVTGVSQSTWEAIGTGGLSNPFKAPLSNQPSLAGTPGRPQFLYVGAEWCPNCAAERWAMINALSRFGTFSNLSQVQSAENNLSTFTFRGSSYTSQYVNFVPREIFSNEKDDAGNYLSLDTLTSAEQQVFAKYGGFPFVDIGNRYVYAQATYNPQVLLDNAANPLNWQTIANSLSDTKSPIAQGILGSANYMTAAICTLTNQQPGNVCQSPVIQQIEQTLNKTSDTAHDAGLALAPADLRATARRLPD